MGWTAGVGDYAFRDSVFGRIEYRYTNLATAGFLNAATNSAEAPNRVPANDLRAGLAYKFFLHHQILNPESALCQARTHYEPAPALYDPVEHRLLAGRFGQDASVSKSTNGRQIDHASVRGAKKDGRQFGANQMSGCPIVLRRRDCGPVGRVDEALVAWEHLHVGTAYSR
jgi:hypothetical protein